MFMFEDSRGKCLGRVAVYYRDLTLQNYLSGVEVFVDEMDGAAGNFFTGGEDPFVNVEARVGGEQAGMDVYYSAGKRSDERRRKQTHVTGEANQFRIAFF
jgi:hypothetical protein